MALQDSPSIEHISESNFESPEPEKNNRRVWILLGVIGLILLGILGVQFAQSDMAAQFARSGSVSGTAVNENGDPIPVEILIFSTDIQAQSNENGEFLIDNVPSGEQSIIIAYGSVATEIDLEITPGVENPLGTITVPTELLYYFDE